MLSNELLDFYGNIHQFFDLWIKPSTNRNVISINQTLSRSKIISTCDCHKL